MVAPILTTKLYAPTLHTNWVTRPRLLERLRHNPLPRLTLISAPAGFGKTTLASEWAKYRPDPDTASDAQETSQSGQNEPRFVWLTLDESDNDPVLFLSYLLAALQTAEETLGQSVQGLLNSPQPPPVRQLMSMLINEAAQIDYHIVLMLDDYHLITNPAIHEALTYLINHLPHSLHLALVTRADPPLPLARWRVAQDMTEIRAQDLRFTTEEAAAFLQQVWGIAILPQQVAALEARTEGWVAGLQLAALSLQRLRNPEEIAEFVADFTGSHRFVLDYLADEVLQQQPAANVEFLLQTSILDRLCAGLCDAVTGRNDSQEMLEILEAANLFLVPLDEQRHWYRYHHLFRDLLRHRLRQAQNTRIAELHRRAAAWYGDNGLTGPAFDHALAAGDMAQAAQLVETTRWEIYSRGEIATLERRLAALPQSLIDSTGALALTQVWILLHMGKLQEVADYVARILPGVSLNEPLDERVPESWRGELGVIQTQIAINRTEVEQAISFSLQTRPHIPAHNLILQSMAEYFIGHAYRLSGRLDESYRAYGKAADLGEQTGNRLLQVTALHALATIHEFRGQMQQAESIHIKALAVASDGRGSYLPVAAYPLAGLGRVHREWHRVEEAIAYLQQAIELSRPASLATPMLDAVITLARLRMKQGDGSAAQAALESVESIVSRHQIQVADLRLGALAAWVALEQDNLEGAAAWAKKFMREFGDERAGGPSDWFETEYIILARIWLALDRLEEANQMLNRLLAAAEAAGRPARMVEMLAVQAMLYCRKDEPEHSLEILERALLLAQPGGLVCAFVNEGRPMGELLARVALGNSPTAAYARHLLTCFESPPAAQPQAVSTPTPNGTAAAGNAPVGAELAQWLAEPLSDRELEVLELVAQGCSNREVGERLYISVPTVKKHMENIHGKLYVHSRTQAVARARELGILAV